jgi:hypothetical protein
VTQQAVLIPVFLITSCDVNNHCVSQRTFLILRYQLKEEAGSAEEQPASNKADAYTIVKGAERLAPFTITIGKPNG